MEFDKLGRLGKHQVGPTVSIKITVPITDKVDMSGMVSQHYLLANAMNGIGQNHELISQNIANVNTPNYKAKQLVFSDFMDQIKNGEADKGMLGDIPAEFITGLQQRKDGNNVDLDGQVSALKKNALLFQTYSHLLASKMSIARQAMSR